MNRWAGMLTGWLILLSVGFGGMSSAQAEEKFIPRRQEKPPGPPLAPEEAIEKMTVPKGFSVELVASEPDLVNPVAMTFDEQGRIWVTESVEYPRRSPGKGRDRVKVLEDTTGDGRVDKVTVFAEGLNIPSGIAVGYGGVWVANAPDILFLQDTDGDLKADRREVVVTGFGRTDTHELPNSLTWGPDGWLYGLNGVFNHSHVKHQGEEFRFTCAMFRIHPRTHEFQLFAEGTSNPWGIAWDNEGSAFISACVIDHLWHITESGYYHRQGGPYPPFTWKLGSIVEHKHQKAAYCGLHFFDSDAYPAKYRERLYMGNIHGNCINVDVLERDDSSYFAKGAPDFLSANDVWFMPVAQKTGPDGCLYVLDWYDRYHCYQDANRDPEGVERLKGRLYRIRYKGTPRADEFNLAEESDAELIERLHSPNVYFRSTAQRVLTERNDPETRKKLQRLVMNDQAPRKARMHALWVLVGSGRLEEQFHRELLSHEDESYRTWAVRAAGNMREVSRAVREKVVSLGGEDTSADVALQVAIASVKIAGIDPIPTLLEVQARFAEDKLIPHIVWENVYPLLEENEDVFLETAREMPAGKQRALSALMPRVVEFLLSGERSSAVPIAKLFSLLIEEGEADLPAARRCLEVVAQRVQNGEIRGTRLKKLQQALQPVLHEILTGSVESNLYLDAALLATTWNDQAGVEAVRQVLVTTEAPNERRLNALEALVAVEDAALLNAVEKILSQPKKNAASFRGKVLGALGRLDDARVAEVVLKHYERLEPELQPRAIELLTQRVAWSKRLMEAIGREEVSTSALNLNQVRRLLATGDEELARQVREHWGAVRNQRDPQRELVIAEMRELIREKRGDPFAGRKVFKKVCAQCHKIYGEGVEIGPDLTSNGRNSFDQLLSNVFDPSLVIGAAYQAHTVVTTEGRVLTGLVAEKTPQRVVLKVQGGKEEVIARDDIELMKTSEVSMMPEKLEDQIKPQEIVDLFAFLTLDKPPEDESAVQLAGVHEIVPRETKNPEEFRGILSEVAPGFTTEAVGEGGLALLKEYRARSAVVRTHPLKRDQPCVLRGEFRLPNENAVRLVVDLAHHEKGDWKFVVKVNGRLKLDALVGPKTTNRGWASYRIDLSEFAGETVEIELHNHPNNWSYEFGYWGRAAIVTE